MFDYYQTAVHQTYHELKKENKLSSNLKFPTPANLKNECILACIDRLEKKDEKALTDFFGQKGEGGSWHKVIKKMELGKFKPLVSFLKSSEPGKPREIYVEIIAWLIGFKERPYDFVRGYFPKEKKVEFENIPVAEPEQERELETELVNQIEFESGIAKEEDGADDAGGLLGIKNTNAEKLIINKEENSDGENSIVYKEPSYTFPNAKVVLPETDEAVSGISFFQKWNEILSLRKLIVPAIFVLIAIVAIYLFTDKKGSPGGCMYWTGDHYESITCHPRSGDTAVVALDSQRLTNFRKITRPDTITYSSINRVWYSKIKNNLEFYTGPGDHPVERRVKLKPITAYMIDKHIAPLQQMGGVAK